jgi:lipoprotein-releasing system permease protein
LRNLPFFIARRYFLSKKKKSFINVLSIISMLGVAVGTMALVIVLSVFNGLEDLIRSLYNSFDADLQITLNEGKFFEADEALLSQINETDGVTELMQVVEDNVLVKYNNGETVVRMKGVDNTSTYQSRLAQNITEGSFKLTDQEQNFAVLGRGIRYELAVNPRNEFLALQFYYPKDIKPGITDPSRMYNSGILKPAGVFAIEKQYDEKYIFVPLRFAKQLLSRQNELTAIELMVADNSQIQQVQQQLKNKLGERFKILNSEEQHASLLRAIKIEKLFVYLTFSFILAVASFNIFFSLTMLALDKKRDISIMHAMGIHDKMIRNIFLFEGGIISLSGALFGALIGLGICLLQQQFGIVSMGMASAVTDAYPVKIQATDFIYTMATIITITFLASLQPAIKAMKFSKVERL